MSAGAVAWLRPALSCAVGPAAAAAVTCAVALAFDVVRHRHGDGVVAGLGERVRRLLPGGRRPVAERERVAGDRVAARGGGGGPGRHTQWCVAGAGGELDAGGRVRHGGRQGLLSGGDRDFGGGRDGLAVGERGVHGDGEPARVRPRVGRPGAGGGAAVVEGPGRGGHRGTVGRGPKRDGVADGRGGRARLDRQRVRGGGRWSAGVGCRGRRGRAVARGRILGGGPGDAAGLAERVSGGGRRHGTRWTGRPGRG